ncbi:acyltransferase family protein [Marivirga harenae]|uniref:acyltransferase family protein n=1 Tax=Marivirga harenae TaxID=2010992 RepID=UPI0026DF61A4|nr:acyltransferase [Marivirga harenae]WKV12895.1 acyltransferase [Marivirga harenae]
MKQEKKPFLDYIHNFRGLAIIFIVGIHSIISIPWEGFSIAKSLLVGVFNNGTVLFVFIAGFLFYYLCHDTFDYFQYLHKKLKYVIAPYLIISIPAIVDKLFFDDGGHWWMTVDFQEASVLYKIFLMVTTGRHSGILWFIPMISIFYFCSFLFRLFSKHKLFDYLVPIICILGLWTVRFGYHANPLISFVHFLPIYLLGMWVAKHRLRILSAHIFWLFSLIGIYLAMTILEVYGIIPVNKYLDLRDLKEMVFVFNLSKLKAILLCFLLIIGFNRLNDFRFPLLNKTGNDSFGIFFLHLYIINFVQILERKQLLPIKGLNTLSYLIYLLAIILVAIVIIFMIRKVFGKHSRIIVGS